MPKLKQLSCSVEHSPSDEEFAEYQTTYSDGYVQTFIAIPDRPTSFSIHLQSDGYIAPGLAMFVYVSATPRPYPRPSISSNVTRRDEVLTPSLACSLLTCPIQIDGVYQCNRNRQNLRFPDLNTPKEWTDIDFRVRQKEEQQPDGTYLGKAWSFGKVKTCKLLTSPVAGGR